MAGTFTCEHTTMLITVHNNNNTTRHVNIS